MGQWVVTVAGIAILSVLCDIILPEGQTRKYVKTVFGVVVTLIIVQPVVSFFSGGLNYSTESFEVQQGYIESVENRQEKIAKEQVRSVLEANGIELTNITISEEGVTAYIASPQSTQTEQTVRRVVAAHFSDVTLHIVWV